MAGSINSMAPWWRARQAFSRFCTICRAAATLENWVCFGGFPHSLSELFFWSLLQALDQQQLEVVCYYTDTQRDEVTARLQVNGFRLATMLPA